MKNILIGIVAGLFLAAIAFGLYQHYVVSPELKAKEDAYNSLKKSTEAEQKVRDQLIADQFKHIAAFDGLIQSANERIATLNDSIVHMAENITHLEGDAKTLRGEVQPIINANPKLGAFVLNLDTQIANYKQLTFSLRLTNSEKDNIISGWTQKFDAMKKISDLEKQAYDAEHVLRLKSEDLYKTAKSKIVFTGLWAKVATAGAAILGGIAVYNLVHK